MTENMFKDKVKHLSSEKQSTILDFVKRNIDVFAKDKFDVGNVTGYSCPINLSSNIYVAKKPFRCTYEDPKKIDDQCRELLNKGIIFESTSVYASPVTLQFEKHGLSSCKVKDHMCVDYYDLNKVIVPKSQPFPLIEDIITKNHNCSIFRHLMLTLRFTQFLLMKKIIIKPPSLPNPIITNGSPYHLV